MMVNFELTIAKYIIIALLLVIATLVCVIFALGKQINKLLNEKMQEEKAKKDFYEN